MIKYFVVVFLAMTLAACDVEADPPRLQDQQIVCTLKGEAYIFIEGYQKSIHSVRSQESDPLCQPLKAFIKFKPDAPASGASK